MIFFSSDFHFCHKNIVQALSTWSDKNDRCRNFNSTEEMNTLLINNINSKIAAEDTLYFLGDFAFDGIVNYFTLREKINCKDIHFIWGNHDNKHSTVIDPEYNGKPVSSLFSSYTAYTEFYLHKTLFCLFHFPIASWHSMSSNSIHLHGHTHRSPQKKFDNGGKSMDVGVDGNNFMPYSLDEIFEIMKTKNRKTEGHH